jgi:hypothetical protein
MQNRITKINDIVLPDGKEWYFENCVDSNILTITVGDSWTWGDSLGKAISNHDTNAYRLNHIYGRLLAQYLKSDFINIGIPGGSNLYILTYLKKVLASLSKTYNKTYIVFTLTESGRELNNGFLQQREHYNAWAGESWPSYESILAQEASAEQLQIVFNEINNTHFEHVVGLYLSLRKATNLIDLFTFYEIYTVNCIRKIAPNAILARNFTTILNRNLFDIRERWTDVIATNGNLTPYPDDVFVMSKIGLDPLIVFCQHLEKNQFKNKWVDVLAEANNGVNWLHSSPYNGKTATKHPLEQGHQWWAEHLYNYIEAKKV